MGHQPVSRLSMDIGFRVRVFGVDTGDEVLAWIGLLLRDVSDKQAFELFGFSR